ncbi:MAG: hypothetical protein RJQ14_01290 [Marinoscillum sp.]
MKTLFNLLLAVVIAGCTSSKKSNKELDISHTWLLLNGTTITNEDTVITDYTRNQKFIKIINDTHFAFFRHDLTKGADSTNSIFVAGAGSYTLRDNDYHEHLEFINYREWEGHEFDFTLTLKGDTLIQEGREKIEELGVDRVIIEKYVRLK